MFHDTLIPGNVYLVQCSYSCGPSIEASVYGTMKISENNLVTVLEKTETTVYKNTPDSITQYKMLYDNKIVYTWVEKNDHIDFKPIC